MINPLTSRIIIRASASKIDSPGKSRNIIISKATTARGGNSQHDKMLLQELMKFRKDVEERYMQSTFGTSYKFKRTIEDDDHIPAEAVLALSLNKCK
jgi:hypothetical protein